MGVYNEVRKMAEKFLPKPKKQKAVTDTKSGRQLTLTELYSKHECDINSDSEEVIDLTTSTCTFL